MHDSRAPTITALATDLAAGRTSSETLVAAALARIDDEGGEGARAFLHVDRDAALTAARASDQLRRHGVVPSPLAGVPISIKDLFDIAGQTTTAGSKILRDAPPATHDAPVVARLRAAGAIPVGRTNMTEFAFSGLGLNGHCGTPGNPADRDRIPGGSSAGGGVAVADGMAIASLGTDTGGSVRIPSAFCGITGFKPTQARIPLDGCTPLSSSLDSIGPLAASVSCCTIMDAVLAGEPIRTPTPLPLAGLRFGVPTNYVLDGMDAAVATAFESALTLLSAGGARIAHLHFDGLDELPSINAAGGLAAAEAYAWHRKLIEQNSAAYDPRVGSRIQRGASISAADYIELKERRAELIDRANSVTAPYDAMLMPTVPVVPPRFAEVASDDDYYRLNALILRNCTVGNFLDRCAFSLPCHAAGALPVGLMLMGEQFGDHKLQAAATTVETALAE